jgi:hypothetical protein
MSNTLTINKDAAIKAHGNANDPAVKKLLEDLFGATTFSRSFLDILNNASSDRQLYEQACDYLKEPVRFLEDFSFLGDNAQYHFSLHRITTVIEAAKEGKELDYDNANQVKYYPWADVRTRKGQSAGSGFAFYGCGYVCTYTCVGSRLSSFSRQIAEQIFNIMIDDYRHFMKPISK